MHDERWVDLHAHTDRSDGTDSPVAVAELAASRGVSMLAVADHDTDAGVEAARVACRRLGIALLPAVEIDAHCARGELHLLAYGADTSTPSLRRAMERANAALFESNFGLLHSLRRAGYPIDIDPAPYNGSQLHVAIRNWLFAAGLAQDRREVYRKFMGNPELRQPGPRIDPEEILSAVADAGGVTSLAHPCKLKVDDEATVRSLAGAGLWGLEVYYGDGGEAYIPRAQELAHRYGLHPTIGSDYHGSYRDSSLGMRVPGDSALFDSLEHLGGLAR